jgi:hypothetical protein
MKLVKIVHISVVTTVYIVILIIVSPMVDHFFDKLPADIRERDPNPIILLEIIGHIIVLSIAWFLIDKYASYFLRIYANIRIADNTQTAVDIVSGVALVGLQKNLIAKLTYITGEHPFRVLDL